MNREPRDSFHLAIAKRRQIFDDHGVSTDALRLIHGAGDGFPGITVDALGGVLLVETHAEEADPQPVIELARDHFGTEKPIFLKERWCQDDSRRDGTQISGPETSPDLVVRERGLSFALSLTSSEHIGLFLDTRPARQRIRAIAADARLLNLFSYTGGFGVAAEAGGARSTTNVDNKRSALAQAKINYDLNNLRHNTRTFLLSDAFKYLSRAARGNAEYDVVVLDPPPKSKRPGKGVFHVKTGYRSLLAKALKVLAPRGTLLAGLNYTGIDGDMFQHIVRSGLEQSGKQLKSLELVGPGRDFPYSPERPSARFVLVSMDN